MGHCFSLRLVVFNKRLVLQLLVLGISFEETSFFFQADKSHSSLSGETELKGGISSCEDGMKNPISGRQA